MTKFRLKTYELTPPGGFPFTEKGPPRRQFPSQPMIEAQAVIVSNFRKANNLPRASLKEALQDIDQQTCQRLGNMPQYCTQADPATITVSLAASHPIVTGGCKGCGAPVQ